jgi:hypothetical protein
MIRSLPGGSGNLWLGEAEHPLAPGVSPAHPIPFPGRQGYQLVVSDGILQTEPQGPVREVMNATKAPDFPRIPYDNFRKIAPPLPRHAETERRYAYVRERLLTWLLRR